MFNLFKKNNDPIKLAEKASKTGDPEKAIDLYSEAIKFEKEKSTPDNEFLSEIYGQRGEIYLSENVALLSSSDFIQAIELNEMNGMAHNNLGIWFTIEEFSAPDFEKAMVHLNKAVECCPNRSDFKMSRAVTNIKKGNKEEGRQELEQLKLDGYADAEMVIEMFC